MARAQRPAVVYGERLEDLRAATARFEYGPVRADGSRSVRADLGPDEALPLRRAQLRAAGALLQAAAETAVAGSGTDWPRIERLWHDALVAVLERVDRAERQQAPAA